MKANLRDMVHGLKDFVEAGLPAQLRLVETELANGIALPDPKIHHVGFMDPFTAQNLPLIYYLALFPETEQVIQAEWLDPRIEILTVLTHSKPATLEEMLLEYFDAQLNLFASDRSCGGHCDNSEVVEQQLGHPGGDDATHAVIALTIQMHKLVDHS